MMAAALLTAALWLRTPDVRYLAPAAIATVIAAALLRFGPRPLRSWGGAAVVVLGAFCVVGAIAQREFGRIEHEWTAYRAERVARGGQRLEETLDSVEAALSRRARTALEAPDDTVRAFAHL